MGTPYRSAATREEEQRALGPELEMRLLLEQQPWSTDVALRAAAFALPAFVALAFSGESWWVIALTAVAVLAWTAEFPLRWLWYRRKVRALGAKGYDVESLMQEARVRVTTEPPEIEPAEEMPSDEAERTLRR